LSNPLNKGFLDWLDGMRRIRTAIEWDYWEISRKAQERAGLTPIIPSYMKEARSD